MKYSFAETVKVLPVLAPADIVATATNTQYVNLKNAAGLVEFEINFGAIASTDSTGEVAVTVEASTSNTATDSGTAIVFNYRLTEAVATDSMGAISAATVAGATVNSSTDDNKTLLVYVDPSVVQAVGADYIYARAVITPTSEITSTIVGAVCRFIPRYAQNSMPSST